MDAELAAVGDRIRSMMPLGMSQRELAEKAGMTTDALSRALNGQRGFASRELARIADQLGADLHWLIAGTPDPQRVDIAARHQWDPRRRTRTNPGRDDDEELLKQVVAAYRAAFPEGPPATRPLPRSPQRMRSRLGDSFVRHSAERVGTQLEVDVVRIPCLTTDYSLRIGRRAVILLATMPSWFRSNWSLAHELGHLALGHHDDYASTEEKNEGPADQFAADLLLPRDLMASENWREMDERGLVRFLWETGVSTEALKNRMARLRLKSSAEVGTALASSTPKLIRAFAAADELIGGEKAVTLREQQASTRLVPSTLVEALHHQVETGKASPEFLAWALDVPVDEIDFPEPDDVAIAENYSRMLEDRPAAAELEKWLAMSGPHPR
jgi:Zn-dependent peptidase ImmA (M78 family)/transcriptional regulator with XRE-family HTH domain